MSIGFLLWCIAFCVSQVAPGFILVPRNVTGELNTTVTFSLITNITNINGKVALFSLDVQPEQKVAVFAVDTASLLSQERFGNRLKVGYKKKSGSDYQYDIEITALRYKDEAAFYLKFLYEIDGVPNYEEHTFSLYVYGSPEKCGGHLPSNKTFEKDANQTISINLCGNPSPNIEWFLHSAPITDARTELVSNSTTKTHLYTLHFPKLSYKDCGKLLSYNATGHSGSVQGNTTLYMKFQTTAPEINELSINGSCINVTWNRIDIGECSGLTYEGEVIINEQKLTFAQGNTTSFRHCFDLHFASVNFAVRGIYLNVKGAWGSRNKTKKSNIASSPSPDNETTEKPSDSRSTIGFVVAAIAIALMIILIISVVCLLYQKKKNGNRRNKKTTYKNGMVSGGYDDSVYVKPHSGVARNGFENNGIEDGEEQHDEEMNKVVRYFDPAEFGLGPENGFPETSEVEGVEKV